MESDLVASLIIAIVQGVTEWFPISSSGHLVLFERLLGFKSGGIAFDVALHFGTLMAVFVYFGKDIVDIIEDIFRGKWSEGNGRIGWLVAIATIPAAIAGYIFLDWIEMAFNSLGLVALGFGVTALLMFIASFKIGKNRKLSNLGYGMAFLIGVAQILALFPGISRSGITLVAALVLGLKEKEALKFSFLMSIPIIFGASIIAIGNDPLPTNLIWATGLSFFVGLATIHLLYSRLLTDRRNLVWFGLYAGLLALGMGIWLLT